MAPPQAGRSWESGFETPGRQRSFANRSRPGGDRVSRSSYIVSTMPSISRLGFSVRRIRMSVSSSSENPSSARYSHWMGTDYCIGSNECIECQKIECGWAIEDDKLVFIAEGLREALQLILAIPPNELNGSASEVFVGGTTSRPSTCDFCTIRSKGSFKMSA